MPMPCPCPCSYPCPCTMCPCTWPSQAWGLWIELYHACNLGREGQVNKFVRNVSHLFEIERQDISIKYHNLSIYKYIYLEQIYRHQVLVKSKRMIGVSVTRCRSRSNIYSSPPPPGVTFSIKWPFNLCPDTFSTSRMDKDTTDNFPHPIGLCPLYKC